MVKYPKTSDLKPRALPCTAALVNVNLHGNGSGWKGGETGGEIKERPDMGRSPAQQGGHISNALSMGLAG